METLENTFMNEQAKKLYNQAKENYPTLKAQIEAQVVHWFWAIGGMGIFSLEPFYFEQNHYSKSKIVKEIPEKKANNYEYGINVQGEIILVRSYTGTKDFFYEMFYFREENQIISYRFDYTPEKKCDNVKIFTYKNGLLQHIYSAFEGHRWWKETMHYKNNKLVQRNYKGIDYYLKSFNKTLIYTYDALGELQTIKEGDCIWYQKKDKKVSYKRLSEKVAERFYALLVLTIKAYIFKEPLYCVNLSFDYQNIMPPMIGFGTESERQGYQQIGKEAKHYLWNTTKYTHTMYIETNDEDIVLFNLFNQETEMQEKYSAATKLLVDCAKRLKDEWFSLGIPSTDDFVVVVSDEEQSTLKFVK